jgi:hypothetical protein
MIFVRKAFITVFVVTERVIIIAGLIIPKGVHISSRGALQTALTAHFLDKLHPISLRIVPKSHRSQLIVFLGQYRFNRVLLVLQAMYSKVEILNELIFFLFNEIVLDAFLGASFAEYFKDMLLLELLFGIRVIFKLNKLHCFLFPGILPISWTYAVISVMNNLSVDFDYLPEIEIFLLF